jgi:coatomer protein complex subunit alpha (xenin)
MESLAFHHLLQGNSQKLEKIESNTPSQRLSQTLYSGNIEERIRVLCESGQLALAYLSAITHGLSESASEIAALIKQTN